VSHFMEYFALYQSQKEVRQLSSGKMRQDLLNRSTECRNSIFLLPVSFASEGPDHPYLYGYMRS